MAWRLALYTSWQAANFQKARRLPTLESAMSRLKLGERKPRKTPEQWLQNFEALAAHLGGEGLAKRPQLKPEYLEMMRQGGE
jgi:hypothetical protein